MCYDFIIVFAFFYSKLVDPVLRDVRLYLPYFSRMKAGDRVLDVCCGTGDQALHYARRKINADGIDLSADMVSVAEKSRRKLDLGHVSFQRADAASLPFKHSVFDYVSICFGLHEKERTTRDEVIDEMKRVVKKGGILVFVDFAVPLPRNRYTLLAKTLESIAGKNHFQGFRDYLEQGGLPVLLKKHNLREEKAKCIKGGIATIVKARNE